MIYLRISLSLVYLLGYTFLVQNSVVNAADVPLNGNYTRMRRDINIRYHSFSKQDVFGVFQDDVKCDKEKEKENKKNKKESCVTDCVIDLKNMDLLQPLLLHPDNWQKLYMPEENRINLKSGDELIVSCTSKNKLTLNIDKQKRTLDFSSTSIRCTENNQFEMVDDDAITDTFSFLDLKCDVVYDYELQISPDETDKLEDGVYNLFRVGFPINDTTFVPTYGGWTCLTTGRTAYVRSVIQKNPFKEPTNKDDNWSELPGDLNPNNLQINLWFRHTEQIKSLDFQYGCDGTDNSGDCMYHTESAYLYNRGHLTPKSSFMYKVARVSTFTLPNAAPQVIHINNANWVAVEEQAQYLAKNARGAKALEVITGTYGKIKIGDNKYLHLHATESELALPVPLYFWKLIYQAPGVIGKQTGKGIVFVTLNKILPHVDYDTVLEEYLCERPFQHFDTKNTDVGEVVKKFNLSEPTYGYTYACQVADFLTKTNNLADMPSLLALKDTINSRILNDKDLGLLSIPKRPQQTKKSTRP